MNRIFSGKKILFIAPKTFGYETLIFNKLTELGASVRYYDDRPSASSFSKVIVRLFPFIIRGAIRKYFLDLISETKGSDFDYIFCIKQECFPEDLLKKLFSNHENSRKIFYTWDSFKNNSNSLKNLKLFDACFTFDHKDAATFGLLHRPLFYFDGLATRNDCCSTYKAKYDCSFIGSVHIHRYQFLRKIIESMPKERKIFIYQYVPNVILYYVRKLLLFPYYGGSSKAEFKFKPLSKEEVETVFLSSKVIIDYSHHNQHGLTMRTVEALGAKKKLITNNQSVLEYDFYNEENIHVLCEGDYSVSSEFMDSEYSEVAPEIYERYSLTGWLSEIFIRSASL